MKRLLFYVLLLFLMISCGVLPQKNTFYKADSNIELGVVGEKRTEIRKTSFNTFGVPFYDKKIKVSLSVMPFSKKTFKVLQSIIKEKQLPNTISYSDSLKIKPTYVKIEIQDKVGVISALNKDTAVFDYLKNSPDAVLVSSIQLYTTPDFNNQLKRADAYYLQSDKNKKTWLYLYKNEQEIDKLDIKQTVVFQYKLSSFCWDINYKNKVVLSTLVGKGQKCALPTQKNAQKLECKRKNDFYKF